jgi:hypothetical protein
MSEIQQAVKDVGENDRVDYEYIAGFFDQEASDHEAKASASRFCLVRWWHSNRARAKRNDAAFIRRMQAKYEGEKA